MLEIQEKDNIEIVNMIYEVRGKQVMIDSDVAMLFGYETKDLNRNVKQSETFPRKLLFSINRRRIFKLEVQFFHLKFKKELWWS